MLRGRRRLRIALGVVAVVAAGLAAAAYLVTRPPGDISNPDVGFEEPTETPQPDDTAGRDPDRFRWPIYGFTPDHRRVFATKRDLRGPFRVKWRRRAPALLEFPPVIARGLIIQLADNGEIRAMHRETGQTRWKRDLGHLSASTPAISGDTVFATILEIRRGVRRGRIVAMRLRNGKVRWSRDLASRSESSPIVAGGKVYFGSENGTVYAMRATNGRVVWTYRAPGAVKGSPTLANGLLYFGDYSGRVHAIRTLNGRAAWRAAPARRTIRGGRFYATAAVAYGRVYIGATDGRQYSLGARTGKTAWARQTGGYVYSSAAVDTVPGLGPSVFFGSYDGKFYALDARSGRTRWTHDSGGKISGSPTVIGRTVYFSDLGRERTYGLDTRTGRVVFGRKQGGYDPVISDGRTLYLTGQGSLSALAPISAERARARSARRRAERRQARERRDARRARIMRQCRHPRWKRCRRAVRRQCRRPNSVICRRLAFKVCKRPKSKVCHQARRARRR